MNIKTQNLISRVKIYTCGGTRVEMYSATTFALLVIISCLSTTVHSIKDYAENKPRNADARDCALWLPDDQALAMPIPFTSNGSRHWIMYPNKKGRLNVKFGHNFKLSCTSSGFASSRFGHDGDAPVTCAGGDLLRHNEHTYRYEEFKCITTPKSELRTTFDKCQGGKYDVVTVGFQTKHTFLSLYSVCFDRATKNSLYTWYVPRSPYYNHHQRTNVRPSFSNTRELYGITDTNRKYTVAEQRKTLAKILKSTSLADGYIQNDSNHSLSRGHYAAKADFFFGFEQSATFYYVNVAPQWQIFNGYMWSELEENLRSGIVNNTDGRHVIVTGSYGSCTLADRDGVQRPLFLDLPHSIPVPLFYWKMYYDINTDFGIVYIGLNNPYKRIDGSVYICPNICSDSDGNGRPDANRGLVYCCTKKSFEDVYGKLDPVIYRSIQSHQNR